MGTLKHFTAQSEDWGETSESQRFQSKTKMGMLFQEKKSRWRDGWNTLKNF